MELYKKAYNTVTKQKEYKRAQVLWKTAKANSHLYESEVLELKTKGAQARTLIMAHGKKRSLLHQQKKKEDESSLLVMNQNAQKKLLK